MVWLVSHIWVLVAGTGLLAFAFGLGLRGLMLRGKLRRTEVERDVAVTELEQARSEIEALYGAQRKLRGEGDAAEGARLREELAAREEKLARLTSELSRSKEELDALKAAALAHGSDPAPQAADPSSEAEPGGAVSDATALTWRNRYLESRVRYLEERVQALVATPSADAPQADLDQGAADTPAGTGIESAMARWQLDYLKTRVRVLEDKVARQADRAEVGTGGSGVAEPAARAETVDEELARLRWRNRYLEGRLAYLEERGEPEEAAPAALEDVAKGETTDGQEVSGESATAAPEADPASDAPPSSDMPATSSSDLADDPKAYVYRPTLTGDDPLASDEADEMKDAPHPAATMLASLDRQAEIQGGSESVVPARPDALEKPRGGRGDDLTEIQGVGPRIQDALNGLGIFHFDQVAAWSPENEAWIDDYLNFAGRVARERWVEQARVLADRN